MRSILARNTLFVVAVLTGFSGCGWFEGGGAPDGVSGSPEPAVGVDFLSRQRALLGPGGMEHSELTLLVPSFLPANKLAARLESFTDALSAAFGVPVLVRTEATQAAFVRSFGAEGHAFVVSFDGQLAPGELPGEYRPAVCAAHVQEVFAFALEGFRKRDLHPTGGAEAVTFYYPESSASEMSVIAWVSGERAAEALNGESLSYHQRFRVLPVESWSKCYSYAGQDSSGVCVGTQFTRTGLTSVYGNFTPVLRMPPAGGIQFYARHDINDVAVSVFRNVLAEMRGARQGGAENGGWLTCDEARPSAGVAP